jgi:hypothetical protein
VTTRYLLTHLLQYASPSPVCSDFEHLYSDSITIFFFGSILIWSDPTTTAPAHHQNALGRLTTSSRTAADKEHQPDGDCIYRNGIQPHNHHRDNVTAIRAQSTANRQQKKKEVEVAASALPPFTPQLSARISATYTPILPEECRINLSHDESYQICRSVFTVYNAPQTRGKFTWGHIVRYAARQHTT